MEIISVHHIENQTAIIVNVDNSTLTHKLEIPNNYFGDVTSLLWIK